MIRHLVALKFEPGTTEQIKSGLYADLAGLSSRIEGILDFQSRENVSIEDELVRGFRDVFWFDFRDTSVRDAYLVDEEHKLIGGRIVAQTEGGLDGVFVMDVEV